MDIKIGGKMLLETATLLLFPTDECWISFPVDNWNIKLKIVFTDDALKESATFSLEPKSDHAVLSLANFNNELPLASSNINELGRTKNGRILFNFSGYAIGTLKHLTISFYWEANS